MFTFHTDLHYAESIIRDTQESELKYHESLNLKATFSTENFSVII